jgi:hypothetical protein
MHRIKLSAALLIIALSSCGKHDVRRNAEIATGEAERAAAVAKAEPTEMDETVAESRVALHVIDASDGPLLSSGESTFASAPATASARRGYRSADRMRGDGLELRDSVTATTARAGKVSETSAAKLVAPVPDPAQPVMPPQDDDGVLTAAAWDDARHAESLHTFAAKTAAADAKPLDVGRLIEIRVLDESGRPKPGVQLRVRDSNADGRGAVVSLTTRTDGRAIIAPALGGLDSQHTLIIDAEGGGSSQCDARQESITITVAGTGDGISALDLAVVVDCTGSMGDELSFIQHELEGILGAVGRRHAGISMRVAIVAYRDHGDAFVVETTPFGTVAEAIATLARYRADGGGDGPEAVDEALAATAKLPWSSDAKTARVAVHIADAPPHANGQQVLIDATRALAAAGVAVYPVAGSGTDDAAEVLFRVEAALTGASYCWLTDDSGVGNSHAEPHVPWYRVEKLRPLLARMIDGELAGRPIPADPGRVLRTVGEPPKETTANVQHLFSGMKQKAREVRAGFWLIAWGDYETSVVIDGGKAAITTTDTRGRELVRYEGAMTSVDGEIAIDARNSSVSGPDSARWSPDSFLIRRDGSVSAIDDAGQAGAGAAAGAQGG